jgi:hypothetical protein
MLQGSAVRRHAFGHHHGFAGHLHAITGPELAAALGFLETIHPHLAALDALFGLSTGENQPFPFQKLIQPDRLRTITCKTGTLRRAQKKR